jgi:hypothetical protein
MVARLMLGTNRSWARMFGDTRHAMGEVVKEPHDERVRAFRAGGPGNRCGLVELPAGNHVALARRCGACANGPLLGTV